MFFGELGHGGPPVLDVGDGAENVGMSQPYTEQLRHRRRLERDIDQWQIHPLDEEFDERLLRETPQAGSPLER